MTKEEARSFQKERILNTENREEKEEKIREYLVSRIKPLTKVIGYRADKWEVNLDFIWADPSLKKIDFYFPSVVSYASKKMEFILPEYWEKGKYGIMEPRGRKSISPDEAELSIIPSLGFNGNGFRLGRGAGFYDRSHVGIEPKKMIGIGFSKFFSVDFPPSDYDIRVGEIVTELGFYFFRQNGQFYR